MKFRNKTIFLILVMFGILASISSASAFFGLFEEEVNPEELETITSEKFHVVPEGTPLYDAGYGATIEVDDGNKTYFVADMAYFSLLTYFGTNGTNKTFKAKVVNKQVLLNDNATVIEKVYDMNNKELPI